MLMLIFQVILHTAIDRLRTDDYDEINHHGKAVKVDGDRIINGGAPNFTKVYYFLKDYDFNPITDG